VHWRFFFLDFDHFVIILFSAYKDLSLLKFGSGDFIFSPCWNHGIVIQRTMIIFYVYFYTFALFINVSLLSVDDNKE
jgi:hypothetical protein